MKAKAEALKIKNFGASQHHYTKAAGARTWGLIYRAATNNYCTLSVKSIIILINCLNYVMLKNTAKWPSKAPAVLSFKWLFCSTNSPQPKDI